VADRFRAPSDVPGAAPLLPLDGVLFAERRREPPLKVELSLYRAGERPEKTTMFRPGEEMFLVIKNASGAEATIELIPVGRRGEIRQHLLLPKKLKADEELRLPETGTIPIGKELGKNWLILFAGDADFKPAVILHARNGPNTAEFVAERFVHPFVDRSGAGHSRLDTTCDPRRLMKQTIEIETRAP
jgi:hypothetical protein